MKKQRQKINIMPFIVAVVFIIIILAICVVTREIEKRTPSEAKAGILGMNKSDEMAVIVDSELLDTKGVQIDGQIYVPIDIIDKYLNERFYWDSNENVLIFTTPTDIIRAEVGSSEYSVGKNKQGTAYQIVKTEGSDNCYVALDFVAMYSGMQYNIYTEPNRVHIYTKSIEDKAITAKKKSADIRVSANIKSEILKTIDIFLKKARTGIKYTLMTDLQDMCARKTVQMVQQKRLQLLLKSRFILI